MSENIKIYCRVLFINPDTRQYQQNSMKVVPSPLLEEKKTLEEVTPLYIEVAIPLDREYIANYSDYRPEELIMAELGFEPEGEVTVTPLEEIQPILTVEGAKYLRDRLQEETKEDNEEAEEFEDDLFENSDEW